MHAQGLAKRGAAGEEGYMAECECNCERCRLSGQREARAIQAVVGYRTRVAALAHTLEAGDLPKAAALWAILRGEGQTEAQEGASDDY